MDFFYSIVAFFATGGLFMYPILLVFAFGVAIAVERFITLTMITSKNQVVWNKVQPLLDNGDFTEAREMTGTDESTISQVLNMGLSLQGGVRRREDIEIAMEESMMEIVPRLEKRTPYVALASSIATLLGYWAPSWVLSRRSPQLPTQTRRKKLTCCRPVFPSR